MLRSLLYDLSSLKLTPDSPSARLEPSIATRIAALPPDDRVKLASRVVSDADDNELVFNSANHTIAIKSIVDSIESLLELPNGSLMRAYDGEFNLFETAALVKVAQSSAVDPSVRHLIINEQSQSEQRFIARLTVESQQTAATKTGVRPGEATLSAPDPTADEPNRRAIPTAIARNIMRYASKSTRIALTRASPAFASLVLTDFAIEPLYRQDDYSVFWRRYLGSWNIITTPVHELSRALQTELMSIVSRLANTTESHLKQTLRVEFDTLSSQQRQDTEQPSVDEYVAAHLPGAKQSLDERVKRARAALKFLNRRFPLGDEQLHPVTAFRTSFEVRKAALTTRAITSILTHPRVKTELFQHTALHHLQSDQFTRLLSAETITRDNIYRPLNHFSFLPPVRTDDRFVANFGAYRQLAFIANAIGVNRVTYASQYTQDQVAFVDTTANAEFWGPAFQTVGRPSGAVLPSLSGRYFVYARDLPAGTLGWDAGANMAQPHTNVVPLALGDTPWLKKWVAAQSQANASHDVVSLIDSHNTLGLSQPILLAERLFDESGMTRMRITAYILLKEVWTTNANYKNALSQAEAALVDQSTVCMTTYQLLQDIQTRIAATPNDQFVPIALRNEYAGTLVELRQQINKFYDIVDNFPRTPIVIVAANVIETPPLIEAYQLPRSFSELQVLDSQLPARQRFVLTRSLVRADVALMAGVEQFVSTIPALVSSSAASSPMFNEYLRRLQQPATADEAQLIAVDVLQEDKYDAWSLRYFHDALRSDEYSDAMAMDILNSIQSRLTQAFGQADEWVAADPTGEKYTLVDFYLLRRIIIHCAIRRAWFDSREETRFLRESAITPRINSFRQQLTQCVRVSNTWFDRALEPGFLAVARSREHYESVLRVLQENQSSMKEPFGPYQPLRQRRSDDDDSDDNDEETQPRRTRRRTNK